MGKGNWQKEKLKKKRKTITFKFYHNKVTKEDNVCLLMKLQKK